MIWKENKLLKKVLQFIVKVKQFEVFVVYFCLFGMICYDKLWFVMIWNDLFWFVIIGRIVEGRVLAELLELIEIFYWPKSKNYW